MQRRIGGLAAVVVALFATQLVVGVTAAEDPLSRTFVLGVLNASAWYGLTAVAGIWLLRRNEGRERPALGVLAGQALIVVPALVLPLTGGVGPLPVWLLISLVGDALLLVAGIGAAWLLLRSGTVGWDLWRWTPTRLTILGAAALLALSERMPRFEAPGPETVPVTDVGVSIISRIAAGPVPWRMVEIVSLVTVLAVGFAAAALRPRRLAIAVGATLAVPSVPQLLAIALDPNPLGTGAPAAPTVWLWLQTAAVVALALGLVFLATARGRSVDPDHPPGSATA